MENTKLKEEEIAQIKAIQEKRAMIIQELGQIEVLKIQLNTRREAVDAFMKTTEEEEVTLAQFLEETYGKGSINLEDGEFIPAAE